MNIALISDLHLNWVKEAKRNTFLNHISNQIQERKIDLLINAGDNCDGHNNPIHNMIEDKFSSLGIPYVSVMGNHSFIRESDWAQEPKIYEIEGLKIVACTLWTDCHDDPLAKIWFKRNMIDAHMIHFFKVDDMCKVHKEQKAFIFDNKPDIVVTHNPPCALSIGPRFIDDGISNKAFIPEMGNEIADSNIKLWCAGHVHHRHSYELKGTRFYCNPHGYVGETYAYPLDYEIEEIEI